MDQSTLEVRKGHVDFFQELSTTILLLLSELMMKRER